MKINETNLKFGALSNRGATKRAILHHAEATKCTPEDIHRWHRERGWAGAGYHFLVRKDGTVWRLRPEGTVGAHATGANSDSIGICFEGRYQTEEMPQAQIDAGRELVAHLKAKYGFFTVQRHKDVGSTDCPGKKFPFEAIVAGAASVTPAPAPAPAKPAAKGDSWVRELAGCPTLRQGASGGITKLAQRRLIALGYSVGACGADGIFGAGTAKAVRAFQAAKGLGVDAIVGRNTWRKLLGL